EEVLALSRGQALRRAETDARGGARDRRAARAALDRRAEQGTRAVDHQQPGQRVQRAETAEDHDPAGGAELPHGAFARRCRGGDGQRAGRAHRFDARTGRRRGAAAAVPGPVPGGAPMNTTSASAVAAAAASAAIPKAQFDWIPVALVAAIALGALPLIGSP